MLRNFFLNGAVSEKMWKNIAELDSPQMTIRRTSIAFLKRKAKKRTLGMGNNYCFSTAKMDARRPLNVKLQEHRLPCFCMYFRIFI